MKRRLFLPFLVSHRKYTSKPHGHMAQLQGELMEICYRININGNKINNSMVGGLAIAGDL